MLIDDLVQGLLVDAPECPTAEAKRVMLAAAIEFFSDTLAWNEIQDPVILIDEQPVYDIDTPELAQVAGVISAWLPTRRLASKTMTEIVTIFPNWQLATGSEPAYFNNVPGDSTIRVFPTPANANRMKMTLRVAYAPTRASTELPDELVTKYEEQLLCGARSKLFLQPRKPWSEPRLGADNRELFAASKVDERIRVIHDGSPGSITVQPIPFGG